MNFKLAYAAFAFALVVAACGQNNDGAVSADAAPASAGVEAMRVETMGAAQAAPSRPEMKQFAQAVARIGDALATVKDEPGARAAAAQIAEINRELEPLAHTIGGWSDADKRAAAMAAAGEMVNAQQRVGLASANLSMNHPDLMEIVQAELDRMPGID